MTMIPPARLARLLTELGRLGLMTDPDIQAYAQNYGPDSAFTVLAVADGGRFARLASWHELYETEPGLVVTSNGIETLGDRTREEALATSPPAYLAFREAWGRAREQILQVVPPEGQPLDQKIFRMARLQPDGR